ncbi:MAG: hypothetical protein HYT62_00410 [Candidatus Yanofskybacteria bacterium]|nr:hypothetical protein [Candidatus Yanofskybacteria bacterium]
MVNLLVFDKEKKMRTLTKERVKSPVSFGDLDIDSDVLSLELIGDGPNEVIHRKLVSLQEANKKAIVMAEQENLTRAERSRRRDYAKMFVSRYTSIFGINREGMKELVRGLRDKDILLLENAVLERLKKPAILQVVGSLSVMAICIISSLGFILSGNSVLAVLSAAMLSTGIGWFFPLILLTQFFEDTIDTRGTYGYGLSRPAAYFGPRRAFKKKYGPDYFPYQELREELGLIPEVRWRAEPSLTQVIITGIIFTVALFVNIRRGTK